MPLFRVILEDGFAGDRVELKIDGRSVYERDGVTTRMQVGVADVVETDVGGDVVTIDVDVPTRSLSRTITIPSSTPHLGISIEGGQLTYRAAEVPFWYA